MYRLSEHSLAIEKGRQRQTWLSRRQAMCSQPTKWGGNWAAILRERDREGERECVCERERDRETETQRERFTLYIIYLTCFGDVNTCFHANKAPWIELNWGKREKDRESGALWFSCSPMHSLQHALCKPYSIPRYNTMLGLRVGNSPQMFLIKHSAWLHDYAMEGLMYRLWMYYL